MRLERAADLLKLGRQMARPTGKSAVTWSSRLPAATRSSRSHPLSFALLLLGSIQRLDSRGRRKRRPLEFAAGCEWVIACLDAPDTPKGERQP